MNVEQFKRRRGCFPSNGSLSDNKTALNHFRKYKQVQTQLFDIKFRADLKKASNSKID